MAIEPANLIQVQSRLQDPSVRNEDLVKYANNSNPEVPSFLALIEMNRRKQITNNANAFNQSNAASIKDQVASELTQPNQIGVGAIANPFKTDITAGAPGVNLAGSPVRASMTQAPTGIDPTGNPAMPSKEPIKPITGANGGLMSLPVGHFNEKSYAGGGIVAFGDPALNPNENQLVADKTVGGMTVDKAVATARERNAQSNIPFTSEDEAVIRRRFAGAESDPVTGKTTTTPSTPVTPTPSARTPAAGGYQGILSTLPKMAAPTEKSLEELAAERKAVEKMAGVSDDPYSDSRKRMQAMEERQGKVNEEAGLNRLLAQLSSFATADPAKGFGYAGAVSAKASQEMEEKQNALRDKQETAQIEFSRAVAKEEDARRQKDAEGILAAKKDQEKAKFDFQKAEIDRGNLAAHIYQTSEYAAARRDANARADEAKPSAEEKKLLKVQTTVNANPVVKAIADSIKQGTIQMGTEEYYQALRKINEIAKPLYKQAGLPEPEDIVGDIIDAPAKKPGLLERIFGGSSTPAKTSKTVSFNDLPKN